GDEAALGLALRQREERAGARIEPIALLQRRATRLEAACLHVGEAAVERVLGRGRLPRGQGGDGDERRAGSEEYERAKGAHGEATVRRSNRPRNCQGGVSPA